MDFIFHFQHQWTINTALNRIPTIYARICSAAIDLSKSLSHQTNEDCFSFITADTEEFPRCILEIMYNGVISASPSTKFLLSSSRTQLSVQKVFNKHKLKE